jgi:DNA-binding response OmpR family regulator
VRVLVVEDARALAEVLVEGLRDQGMAVDTSAERDRGVDVRVLVVEDARALAEVLVEGLRDQGMAVDVAHDGLEAVGKVEVNRYDVVVLDRDLPGIHGDAICRMIAERDERPMVLMLTASGSPQERVSGLSLGADDYLAKPFHFPELVLRVQALARRRPSARPRTLRAAGIELDPVHRTVVRDGRHLDLSVKEFALLDALLRAAPAHLSTEDLLEQVWDENADPFTNTVTVTIGRLRRKLGDPPVITTVPGVGYRITARADSDHSQTHT